LKLLQFLVRKAGKVQNQSEARKVQIISMLIEIVEFNPIKFNLIDLPLITRNGKGTISAKFIP